MERLKNAIAESRQLHEAIDSKLLDELEKMVDDKGLEGVVEALADICQLKAEHTGTNWQDKDLEKRWNKNALLLTATVNKLVKTGL